MSTPIAINSFGLFDVYETHVDVVCGWMDHQDVGFLPLTIETASAKYNMGRISANVQFATFNPVPHHIQHAAWQAAWQHAIYAKCENLNQCQKITN